MNPFLLELYFIVLIFEEVLSFIAHMAAINCRGVGTHDVEFEFYF